MSWCKELIINDYKLLIIPYSLDMNPWHNFKQQPWSILFLVAGMTVLLGTIADQLLVLVLRQSEAANTLLSPLFSPPWEEVMPFFVGLGLGVLGVLLAQRQRSHLMLNSGTLWALVLCLLVSVIVKSAILPYGILQMSGVTLTGIIVGVFWKGRPYWSR
ncbi:hypothetical protein K4A83_00095 [Spirulina subsalsa FACHB-351]|uniref:Peptide chain release factor 1 n=1 Tax=Spirulina subsalsa FACHB-351 TaxID=234711 RepID=A0ABT3KZJ9_9CYAN|nr:hypothetical protein [Spirulina subsalsa]MCW6034678.1 hypothetical protein [Spirulina subsalsa FACHB-351]